MVLLFEQKNRENFGIKCSDWPGKLLLLFFIVTIPLSLFGQKREDMTWKAGTARTNITPDQPMWMGGYASRDRPSEGVLQDLWIKALVLEDSEGQTGVMVSMDLINIPKEISDHIKNRVAQKYGLGKEQILLNVSHTHTGPEVRGIQWDVPNSEKIKIEKFATVLEDKVVNLIGKAMQSMEPARLYSGNGITRFQVNRRNNVERELKSYTDLNGSNDYAVPVIKAVNENDEISAILFGYACHPTVMSDYQISGDYPGFAQKTLEEYYPDATALFLQGAGGDQNPLPRRIQGLAEQYGRELAAAVDQVLKNEMKPLTPSLQVSYGEISLSMKDAPPKKDTLAAIVDESSDYPGYLKHKASVLLEKLERGGTLPPDYPYPVQVWSIGEQPVFALGGELLVGYAIELKRIFGDEIFVFGYSNDVMGYIPTVTVLREGSYEGNRSPYFTNPWEGNIEYLILKECQKLAKEVGIN